MQSIISCGLIMELNRTMSMTNPEAKEFVLAFVDLSCNNNVSTVRMLHLS